MAMVEIELINIVKNHCSQKMEVTLSSDLVGDLSIDGDDAEELLEELLKQENLELPVELLNRYFHSEGELLDMFYFPKLLLFKLGFRHKPPLRELESFTVKDLLVKFNEKAT